MATETGISLNQKCKELIDQFMEKEFPINTKSILKESDWDFLTTVMKERITSLVEACIYADQHNSAGTIVTNTLNEMEIIKMVWGNRPVYDMAKVISALSIALRITSQE